MKYFLIGIAGGGMTGIATLLKEWGHDVSGSDTTEEVFYTNRILKDLSIPVLPFNDKHITTDIGKVIYSSAYSTSHPQLIKAKKLGIPTQPYSEALCEIFNQKKGIVVIGTHGKTTSTAMLGRVLEDALFDPTVIVGGELIEWKRTARGGKSDWMVAEGDEYQSKFLKLKPQYVLLTNIEYDHPDFYPTEASYFDVFKLFLSSLPEETRIIANSSLREFVEKNTHTSAHYFETLQSDIKLSVWGKHNRTNAAGVKMLCDILNIEPSITHKSLSHFRGTKRRMELYTKASAETVIIDDFAHHPTEIQATLNAIREHYPYRTIIAIFQPHTYSRTKALLEDFSQSFKDANKVYILEIYASARENKQDITGNDLFRETQKNHTHVEFVKTPEEMAQILKKQDNTNGIIVTLGAGNVWTIADQLAKGAESK